MDDGDLVLMVGVLMIPISQALERELEREGVANARTPDLYASLRARVEAILTAAASMLDDSSGSLPVHALLYSDPQHFSPQKLFVAETLFEVAIEPFVRCCSARYDPFDIARALHRAIWIQYLMLAPTPSNSSRLEAAGCEPLTVREAEVLNLVADALTNQQIAARLAIAPGTVKRHIANILRKLSAVSRLDAVRRGRLQGAI